MNIYYISFRAMGCQITIQLQTAQDGRAILDAIPSQVEQIEGQLSRFRLTSDLMRLNECAGEWVKVSEVLFEVIHLAKHTARLTDGLYNPLILPALIANGYDRSFEQIDMPVIQPTPPIADWHDIGLRVASHEVRLPKASAIDLGGIAKGWTANWLAEHLSQFGACLVNIGGDMVARGAPLSSSGWQVGIDTNQEVLWLRLSDTAIATSGIDYRRWKTTTHEEYHHILHPKTGKPAQTDVLSATVIHPHACYAEAYAKTVILLGSQAGLEWLSGQWDAHGLVVSKDGRILATSGLMQFVS
ncbi:MAG: FAD:protein FMN transferase [Phototrophicales bacterium]|nr:MAG: FAD:protein FMN transferase [Phototrophicales bacterium]